MLFLFYTRIPIIQNMTVQTLLTPARETTPVPSHQHANGMAAVPYFRPTVVQSSFRRFIINRRLRLREMMILLSCMPQPVKLYRALRKISQLRKLYFGQSAPKKLAYVDGRYYWGFHSPGWP